MNPVTNRPSGMRASVSNERDSTGRQLRKMTTYVRPSSTFNLCASFRDIEPVVARLLVSILST
jgi:hypothetical protein